MTDYNHLEIDRNGDVVTVFMRRPEKKNAFNSDLMNELTQVALTLRDEVDLRAVILTGDKTYFSVGADLSSLSGLQDARPAEVRHQLRAGPDMCRAWEEIEAITIAAIEGFCVGGACSLVLACDFRIASETTMMRLPEVPLGMNMSWQTLPRLTALIGPSRAKQFAIFGDKTAAPTLLDWGLIDHCVPAGSALVAANDWAARIAALPPMAVRMTKATINAISTSGHHAISHMDRDQFMLTVLSGQVTPPAKA
jgi:enoyl-CoA hydratase/carnithine racemase